MAGKWKKPAQMYSELELAADKVLSRWHAMEWIAVDPEIAEAIRGLDKALHAIYEAQDAASGEASK